MHAKRYQVLAEVPVYGEFVHTCTLYHTKARISGLIGVDLVLKSGNRERQPVRACPYCGEEISK